MRDIGNRREFLQDLSLAGAALIAGGGALAAAGCHPKPAPTTTSETSPTCKDKDGNDHNMVCAWIDENGALYVHDEAMRTQLQAMWNDLGTGTKPKEGERMGIKVSWDEPGSTDQKVNSLCTC